MRRHEPLRLGPQRWYGLGCIVKVDGKAVGFVAVLHIAENVVVDVAEEVDVGLDAPVVAGIEEGWVVVEEAAVPAAHLVVGVQVTVLYVLFFEDFGGFFEEVVVDPGGDGPVFFRDGFYGGRLGGGTKRGVGERRAVETFRFGLGLCPLFECFRKGLVVEEGPGVVEL